MNIKYSLVGLAIDEKGYKPDFEVSDRYQIYSAEVLRISLLGIAVFGFLISDVVFSGDWAADMFSRLGNAKWLCALGVSFLGLSAAAALAHRYFSAVSLSSMIVQQRLRQAVRDAPFDGDAQQHMQRRLERERIFMLRRFTLCGRLLVVATLALGIGFSATALACATVLFS